MEVNSRIFGIDLLRIIATFMIVTLHVLSFGGILENSMNGMQPIWWFIYIISFCSVDCYAIISGYVNYKLEYSKKTFYKLLKMWLHVLFYTVLITFLFSVFMPDIIEKENWINAFFPIVRQEYWYMTAYFIIFLLMPLINVILAKLNRRVVEIVLILLIFVYMGIKSVLKYNVFVISDVILLLSLYILGAYLRRMKVIDKLNVSHGIILFFAMLIGTYITRIFNCYMFIHNDSPTIVLEALSLFIIFNKLRLNNSLVISLIKYFAPVTLGVYLIHTNHLVLHNIIGIFTEPIRVDNKFVVLIGTFVIILLIFVVCSLIDRLRILFIKGLKSIVNGI